MKIDSPRNYTLARFESTGVLMVHKQTKEAYDYFEGPTCRALPPHLNHAVLERGILLSTGALFPQAMTTLGAEIRKRTNRLIRQPYSEEELVNTFLPVLDCLYYIHDSGHAFPGITADSIIVDEKQTIRLREPLLASKDKSNPHEESNRQEDFRMLARILLECSLLHPHNQSDNTEDTLRNLRDRFSKGFLLAIYVMLSSHERYFPHLKSFLENNIQYVHCFDALNKIYRRIMTREMCEVKQVFTPPLLKHAELKIESPKRTTMANIRKILRVQDTENKKGGNEEVKRKNVEHQGKMEHRPEKSNRKEVALKRVSNGKVASSPIHEIQNALQSRKAQKEGLTSSTKRLKTVSRKKIT